MNAEQPTVPPLRPAFVPPTVQPVARVRRGAEWLEVAAEENGRWRYVSLQVWRAGASGEPVQDHRRRLTLRLDEAPAVAEALLAAAALAATVEAPEHAAEEAEQPPAAGKRGAALGYGATRRRKRKAAAPETEQS